MGIKGLFQFLKRYEQECSVTEAVRDYSVGVDLFWFIHHSKGDFFFFQDLMNPILRSAAKVHCVIDGAPPTGTKEERKEKRKKRDEAKKTLKKWDAAAAMADPMEAVNPKGLEETPDPDVEKQLQRHKEKLLHQSWYPTREYVDYIKQWLMGEGCVLHQAMQDADSELVRLEKTGWIHRILSNDSDLLTLGASCVIRVYAPDEAGLYLVSDVQRLLELSPTEWTDFMNLCRCMKKKDMAMAYSFIRVYKEFDCALQKYDELYSDDAVAEADAVNEEEENAVGVAA